MYIYRKQLCFQNSIFFFSEVGPYSNWDFDIVTDVKVSKYVFALHMRSVQDVEDTEVETPWQNSVGHVKLTL